MATIKSYTDIEQSKKLAEILPLESADMRYTPFGDTHPWVWDEEVKLLENGAIPCWSLAALEHLIWNTSIDAVSYPHIYKDRIANGYYVLYGNYETNTCSSIVDACYEMIIKLNELNLL